MYQIEFKSKFLAEFNGNEIYFEFVRALNRKVDYKTQVAVEDQYSGFVGDIADIISNELQSEGELNVSALHF